MHLTQRKILIAILISLIAAWIIGSQKLLFPMNPYPAETPEPNPMTQLYPLQLGNSSIQTEIRRTEAEQELGLSWRSSMAADRAMTFVYSQPQKVLYWMKGMQFPLDFIWVNQGKIVDLTENVPAPTKENPLVKTVSPDALVDAVIEVNAGFIKQHTIHIGDPVKLDLTR